MFDDPNANDGRHDRAPNPFTPIPYSDRLSGPLPEADPFELDQPMRPGQYYTGGWPRVEPTEAPPPYDPFAVDLDAIDFGTHDFGAVDFGAFDFGAPSFGVPESAANEQPAWSAPGTLGADEASAFALNPALFPPPMEKPPQTADEAEIPPYLRRSRRAARPPKADEAIPPYAAEPTDGAVVAEAEQANGTASTPEPTAQAPREKRSRMGRRAQGIHTSDKTGDEAPISGAAFGEAVTEPAVTEQPVTKQPEAKPPSKMGELPDAPWLSDMPETASSAPYDFTLPETPPPSTSYNFTPLEEPSPTAPYDFTLPETPSPTAPYNFTPLEEPPPTASYDFTPPETPSPTAPYNFTPLEEPSHTTPYDFTSPPTPPPPHNTRASSDGAEPASSFDPYARFGQTDRTRPFSPEAFTGRDEVSAFFDDEASQTEPYGMPFASDDSAGPADNTAPFVPIDSATADTPDGPAFADGFAAPFAPVDNATADAPFDLPDHALEPSKPTSAPSGKPASALHPAKQKPDAAAKPPRRRVRPSRLLALIAIAGMVVFCAVVGGGIVADLARNEREMKEFRADYLKQNGVQPEADASRVELLPYGQTFTPTATPAAPMATPTPTPRIAMNDPAIAALNGRDDSGVTLTDAPTATPAPRSKRYDYPDNPLGNVMESMQPLVDEFPDVVGRLVIDGVLDEVVVQKNNTFYLTHNYRGTSSKCGAVFVDESCQLKTPPENLLLRGQSAVEGKVFAPLWQYQQAGGGFVSTAAIATLTTLYEEERYVLFAVVVAGSDPAGADYFNYASYPSFSTDAEMLSYVDSAISHSLYRFNVSVAADDRLLTLATVGGEGGKTLVLIFRMLRSGEGYR